MSAPPPPLPHLALLALQSPHALHAPCAPSSRLGVDRDRRGLLMAASCLLSGLSGVASAAVMPATGTGVRKPALHAFTEPFPPMSHLKDGVAQGFGVELLQLMSEDAGLDATVEVLPWERSMREAARRRDSVLFPLVRTPERESRYRWVGPIGPRRLMIYRLTRRTEVRPASLKALGHWRIGVSRGSAAVQQLEAQGLRAGVELELGLDDDTNLRKLLAGRMDLIVLLDWAAAWQLREMGLPYATLTPVLPLDDRQTYWYGLPPESDPAIARRLQAALDRLKRDGRQERLRQRYFE